MGFFIFDKLHTDHQTSASHIANNVMSFLKFSQLSQQIFSDFISIHMQILLSNNSQDFHSDQTLKMSSSEGIEENSFVCVCDLFSCNNTSHGESITHTFGHRNNIRLETGPPVPPEFLSYSTETGLDLISD